MSHHSLMDRQRAEMSWNAAKVAHLLRVPLSQYQ